MKQVLIALSLSATAATALAHSGATGVVKERMEHMKGIGEATKAIGQMLKGDVAYDANEVAAQAKAIAAAGGSSLTKLFPEGSIMGPSEARPEIWTDWDRFAKLSHDLKLAAQALADGADNAPDEKVRSPQLLFREVAATCKACHQVFRAKK